MDHPRIVDNGRGPQLKASRITIYDVMDYYVDGWPAGRIANWLSQHPDDIRAAIAYIEDHRAEVDEQYRLMLERDERGNSPEVRAIIAEREPFVRAKMAEILKLAKERKECEAADVEKNGSHS